MKNLKLGIDRNKCLEIDSTLNDGTLSFDIGYYMRYDVNKDEAKQIIEHLTKVFEL